jgi:hypothetical protein
LLPSGQTFLVVLAGQQVDVLEPLVLDEQALSDWCRKPEYPKKTTDLLQVADKLDHIMLYQEIPRLSGVRTHNISSQ